MKKIDTMFYPGWVRKAITFSIDDGIVPTDRKFIEILKPAGIKGTFNLCSNTMTYLSKEGYKEFYQGYEIANHCKYHPFAFPDGVSFEFGEGFFDEAKADPNLIYPAEREHLYWIRKPRGWRKIADATGYKKFVDECHEELESVFGKGSVRSFVWPFDEQENAEVQEYLKSKENYYGIRRSGARCAEGNFNLEANRKPWHYTATHDNLLEMAELYEKQEDDDNLKMLCFGVHSRDYEICEKWDDLKKFASLYGNRPQDYFYGTVGEIFDYADAVKKLIISDETIMNPTELDLYIRMNDKNVIIKAGETLCVNSI